MSLKTPRAGNVETPMDQRIDIQTSAFVADSILVIALSIYVLLAICVIWKYFPQSIIKGWFLRALHIANHVYGGNRHIGHHETGSEMQRDSNAIEEDLGLSYEQDGEDIRLLQQTMSDEPASPATIDSRSQRQEGETTSSHSRHSSHCNTYSDDLSLHGISKFFDPNTGRLREDIIRPTETALEMRTAEPGNANNKHWYSSIERAAEELILKAQSWLDDEEEQNKENWIRQRESGGVLCDGERNRAVRQILLARQYEGNGDGESDLY